MSQTRRKTIVQENGLDHQSQCQCQCLCPCRERNELEIVVSGISGRFPESENLDEFWKNLINGVDMITEDDRRWTPGLNGLPTRSGKIKTLDKFDAQFFGVHPKQAEFMDPQLRMLLEVTHEAIIDAGVNPVTIRGSQTGVFVGASSNESEKIWFRNSETKHGYALTGTQRGMLSNRVSFSFDFQGPSFTVDTACSSSFIALEQAVASIRRGHCDAAIVAGSHLCLEPNLSLQFQRLSMLSPDGKCKSFDASGNGYVRSEAVCAIFIQKKNVALRSYASILGARTNSDGYKEKGVTFPSGQRQAELLEETYREVGVDPKDVVYVEAHGTGTSAGDPQELNAIANVFCHSRGKEKPLLIGSVKSNAGHAEPASGLMSMAKVLLSMQQGIIPANLHYNTPNPNIPALSDGRLKVIAENTPWNGGIVGINSFGFGGANVHIILKSNTEKNSRANKTRVSGLPLLIPFSGRTKDAVEFALRKIIGEFSSIDVLPQQLQRQRLLHEIARSAIPGHTVRGHTLISSDIKPSHVDIQENTSTAPVWFIFNGMGSQWPGMGRHLLKFSVFEKSIKDSAAILKPHGIDLMSVLIDDDEAALENSVIKSFVAITCVQVALIDLLRSLDVTPSGGIIGHSVGELGASYADECFTAGQTVLAAFARGKAIIESMDVNVEGAMAAIGMSWEEAKRSCPPGIYPACHNAKDSVTISGPKKDLSTFVKNLKNEGIFAKEVNSSKIAFHSKYIEPAKSKLQTLMEEIIPAPRRRSPRWISSSVPENEWNSPLAQFSSADYHVNNLLSPVLFQECLQKIPEGSIVIEIGPHALLQAILKRSLPKCTNIGLVNKNHADNSIFLLQTLGKLYSSGLYLNFSTLYSPVEFPVTVDTPSISHLIKWDHSLCWNVPRFPEDDSLNSSVSPSANSGEIEMEISLNEKSHKFYEGHKIDGRIIFPATGYLLLIWKAFASLQKKHFEQVPIVLENVSISRATVLPLDGKSVKFHINIFKGTGEFQIRESDVVIVTGIVRSPNGSEFLPLDPHLPTDFNPNRSMAEKFLMSSVDAYKELRLRGYEYSDVFQGIHISNSEGDWAKLKWRKNWVSFLDTILQVAILHKDTRALYLPTYLDKAVFDPVSFLRNLEQTPTVDLTNDAKLVPIFNYPDLNVISCEGIQFQRWKTGMAPRRATTPKMLRLEKFEFTPYFDNNNNSKQMSKSVEKCLSVCLDTVLENITGNTLKMLGILGSGRNTSENYIVSELAQTHILNQPTKTCNGKVIVLGQDQGQCTEDTKVLENAGMQVILTTMENETKIIQEMSSSVDLIITCEARFLKNYNKTDFRLRDQGFLLHHKQNSPTEENEPELDFQTLQDLDSSGLLLVAHKISTSRHFYLFKKSLPNFRNESEIQKLIHTVEINSSPDLPPYSLSHFNYSWVEELKMAMQKAVDLKNEPSFRIYVISKEKQAKAGQTIPSGILGLVNSLRKEPGGDKIRCFFLRDSPEIDTDFNFLKPSKNLQVIMQRDLVMNVFQENVWGSMRFYPVQEEVKVTRTVEHAYLNAMTRGDLSSLRWFESDLKYHKPKSEICSIYYAPLNFRDVMLCTGKLALDSLPNNLGAKECVLGLEWSGKTLGGVRVMGVVQACGLATSIVPDKEFLWDVPKHWTLAEAATVPVAYATAYYSLVVRGKIQKGESVLIHAGAGGVGMAAIRIALSINCTVYTTVGSQEKRDFLTKTFPGLNESSFSNSRDSSFLEHILRETKGRGVDLVLNSLAGDQLQASIKCLAVKGRFLEIGKVDLFKNSSLGMSVFLRNVSVHGILLDGLKDGDTDKLQVRNLVQEGLHSGVVQPLNSTIFTDSVEDVEKAFRFMASGKHVGKILIEIRNEKETRIPQNSVDTPKSIQALPRTHFDPQKCYIIIGGLGGFGLELCGWLIERGARKLALVSRSGVRNGYQYNCIRKWRKEGATIITPTTDTTTLEGATSLLKESMLKFKAPIGGIFNLAMVLADGVIQNQTPETFHTVSRPKLNSTIFLDQVSRTLAPSLEYFVVFSSVVSGRGAAGLSNYAWANSAMERICEQRQKDGLPGLATMWGAIGDVGVLQEEKGMGNEAEVGGTVPQRISSCLNTIDILLNESKLNRQPVLSSMVLRDKTQKQGCSKFGAKNECSEVSLMEKVGNILGMKLEAIQKVDTKMKLHEIGMDSLMSVEIKQLLEMTTGITLSDQDVLNLSFGKLKNILKKSADQMASNANESVKTFDQIDKSPPEHVNLDQNHVQHKSLSNEVLKTSKPNGVICSPPKNLENLENPSKSEKNKIRPRPIKYFCTALMLIITFTSIPFFITLRLGFKIYLKLLQKSKGSKIKLAERPFDEILALNPQSSNITVSVTCKGIPNRERLIQTFEDDLVHWKTNICLDRPTTENDAIYEPYESLQWRLERGLFFFYWVKDPDFSIKNHIVFEEFEESANDTLEDRSLKACEFYSSYNWTNEQDKMRPQWKIKIIAPKNPCTKSKEFCIIFSLHHSYGDGFSLSQLVQHALCDQKKHITTVPSLKGPIENSAGQDQGQSQGQITSAAEEKSNRFGSTISLLLKRFHHLVLKSCEARFHFQSTSAPSPNRHYQWTMLDLNKLKSVRDPESGKIYSTSAVILACAAVAYKKLYKKAGKLDQLPQEFVALMSYVISPYKKIGLMNNAVANPVTIRKKSSEHGNGNEEVEERLRLRKSVRAASDEIGRRFTVEELQAVRDNVKLLGYFPLQMQNFVLTHFSLEFNHIFSQVPAVLPRNYTYFGGYQIKHAHATTMLPGGAHKALISLVDSANDSVSLSLIVDDHAIEISPTFLLNFFYFFHEAFENLVNCDL